MTIADLAVRASLDLTCRTLDNKVSAVIVNVAAEVSLVLPLQRSLARRRFRVRRRRAPARRGRRRPRRRELRLHPMSSISQVKLDPNRTRLRPSFSFASSPNESDAPLTTSACPPFDTFLMYAKLALTVSRPC